ncbi:uncharacterized protein LOC125945040 [Dermacentor silvarum]|uniref:uncharacterized protein LOC125945040 n=1 Tax=Dermacentor silvarum TaxID=543639 RepID=UPI002100CDFC|nr:uncharacterized protein LOC125945040 [Dermacentor silvarum]
MCRISRLSWFAIPAACVCILLVVVVLASILSELAIVKEDEDANADDVQGGGGGGGGSGGGGPSGGSRVLVVTSKGVTSREVPLPPGSLLCTISEGFQRSTYSFPPDGLCSIITFDSLYSANQTLAPPYNHDFEYFLETAMHSQKSEFGIAFHQNTISEDAAVMQLVSNPSTKMYLDELWDRYRIYHYAQVNGSVSFKQVVASKAVSLAAAGLQMISRLMNNKKDPKLRPSYTIVHFWLPGIASAIHLGKQLSTSVSLDIFVLIVHYHRPDINLANCRMVSPTILSPRLLEASLRRAEYKVRMTDSILYLASYYRNWPSTTLCAVTLAMGGRWYTPCAQGRLVMNRPANYSLGHKCGYSCGKFKIHRDNQITDIVKLCKSKKNATNVAYTLAAVDIQFEDGNGVCGYGSYPRLRMLKKLALFFAYNYTSADKESSSARNQVKRQVTPASQASPQPYKKALQSKPATSAATPDRQQPRAPENTNAKAPPRESVAEESKFAVRTYGRLQFESVRGRHL